VHSSASIGVVLCTGLVGEGTRAGADGSLALTSEDVLRNADTAMYEAKRAGSGRWLMFDDSMHEGVVRALAVESERPARSMGGKMSATPRSGRRR
jgi:predicted signal transduction protein with EAL and GGDEF domain